MRHLSGGCLCGKVRYSADADPVFTAICHCKNCQKQAGAAFSLNVGIPAAALALTGPIKTFQDSGDSGKPVRRKFCPECGSPLVTEVEAMPGLTLIKAGTLDDTSWLQPNMEIYCDSAQAWTPRTTGAQQFAKAPG